MNAVSPTADGCIDTSYTWTFNNRPLSALAQFQWRNTQIRRIAHFASELHVFNISRAHHGVYVCRADTAAGHSTQSATVTVQVGPTAPTRPHVDSTGLVRWTTMRSENAQGWQLQVQAGNKSRLWTSPNPANVTPDQTSLRLPTNDNRVRVRLRAHSQFGNSAWSSASRFTVITLPPPRVTVAKFVHNRHDLLVMWTGATTASYSLEYWSHRDAASRHTVQLNSGLDRVLVQLNDTTPYDACDVLATSVFVRVRAHGVERGHTSDYSPAVAVQRPVLDMNIAVDRLRATSIASTSVTFAWVYNTTDRPCERADVVQLHCDSSTAPAVTVYIPSTATATTLRGLHPAITYECRIRAVNLRQWSNVVTVRTLKPRASAQPTQLRVLADTRTSAFVQWQWTAQNVPAEFIVSAALNCNSCNRSTCSPALHPTGHSS